MRRTNIAVYAKHKTAVFPSARAEKIKRFYCFYIVNVGESTFPHTLKMIGGQTMKQEKRSNIVGFKLTESELNNLNKLLRIRYISKSNLLRGLLYNEFLKEGLIDEVPPIID